MKYNPSRKLPHQQLTWSQIWIDHIISSDDWSRVLKMPYGYCVYLNIDDE